MTGLSAKMFRLKQRGILAEGDFADLVVFDPETVIDRATYDKPKQLSVGIDKVFVNGVLAYEAGSTSVKRAGRLVGGKEKATCSKQEGISAAVSGIRRAGFPPTTRLLRPGQFRHLYQYQSWEGLDMSERKELEYFLQQAALDELRGGKIDRRQFLERSLVAGLGMAGVAATGKGLVGSAFAQDRPLTPTFYQWIQDLHPGIPAVNAKFPGINYQIAPVEGFGIERFVAEARTAKAPGTSMSARRHSSKCRR